MYKDYLDTIEVILDNENLNIKMKGFTDTIIRRKDIEKINLIDKTPEFNKNVQTIKIFPILVILGFIFYSWAFVYDYYFGEPVIYNGNYFANTPYEFWEGGNGRTGFRGIVTESTDFYIPSGPFGDGAQIFYFICILVWSGYFILRKQVSKGIEYSLLIHTKTGLLYEKFIFNEINKTNLEPLIDIVDELN